MRNLTIGIAVYTFIVLFLYTGLSKIADHHVFFVALQGSPLIKPYAKLISVLVPLVELIIVCLLLIPRTKVIGLYSSFFLMVLFTAYLVIILSGSRLPCSCGGIFYKISWKPHLYLNIFLTALAAAGIIFAKRGNHQNRIRPIAG